jgi:hypothetical protein
MYSLQKKLIHVRRTVYCIFHIQVLVTDLLSTVVYQSQVRARPGAVINIRDPTVSAVSGFSTAL